METIWFRDPYNLFIPQNILKFIPQENTSLTSQLNAVLRLVIYFCILVFIIKQDAKTFFLAIFIAFITFLIFIFEEQKDLNRAKILEKLEISQNKNTNNLCIKPTRDNPFMNVSLGDYESFPERPPACDVQKKTTQKMIDQFFEEGLNRTDDDAFRKDGSYRQYYTMPTTTIPNDQHSFVNWLYKPKTIFKSNLYL